MEESEVSASPSSRHFSLERCQERPKDFQATYSVEDDVGSGATATIKRAIHRETGTHVAIKVFEKKGMKIEDLEAARNEYHALKHLNHPNVLGVIDRFESPDYLVIVLPLMMSSLADYLKTRRSRSKMSQDDAREIFKMIISGAEHCEYKGIIHRDLKLDNILVNYDVEMRITALCLADFGLCHDLFSEIIAGKDTCGTLPYMAPELFKRGQKLNGKIDTWSLGVILHQLLLDELPFYHAVSVKLAK